jgi:hypothetical protein
VKDNGNREFDFKIEPSAELAPAVVKTNEPNKAFELPVVSGNNEMVRDP